MKDHNAKLYSFWLLELDKIKLHLYFSSIKSNLRFVQVLYRSLDL